MGLAEASPLHDQSSRSWSSWGRSKRSHRRSWSSSCLGRWETRGDCFSFLLRCCASRSLRQFRSLSLICPLL